MPTFDGSNHLAFFKALYRSFSETLNDESNRKDPIESLLGDCFETFERNSENAAGVVCHGGCASCCTIRVAATAPEILLIARTLRSSSEAMGFGLRQRIGAADCATRRLDERCRMDAGGASCEVPVSELHVTVRSLVQNAMQAALRDSGYARGAYELNQALQIALTNEACEAAWLKGHDVFAAAQINDVSQEEMAEAFDAIKAL
ncbi:YkgJ family cysteine cluster protein [Methylocella sp.]|jgi:hypothetical protein|uniref:YkgJ family cysteine cluster protein n=1 Tax=Methylocella sp. TaxID=1978226 RepID=UPI003C1B30FE